LSHKPALACDELAPLLQMGNSILGNIASMGKYLSILTHRLSYCRVESPQDWFLLGSCSQFAQLLGSRYMVKYIAWCAGANASFAEDSFSRMQCVLARLPGGELSLQAALPHLSQEFGYHAAVRMGTEAYWRGNVRLLDAAIERMEGADEAEKDVRLGDPVLELLLLQSCRDKLEWGSSNLADVFSHMRSLSREQRRVYELDAMHLLLSGSDPTTIGMLAQGFELFSSQAQPAD